MGNKFTDAEIRERKFIDWWISKTPECELIDVSNVGSFDRKDFRFIKNGINNIGEIKIRTFSADKYDTIIIEMDKINHLLQEASDEQIKVYYFAVYPESRCYYIIDVMKIPHTITYEYCPKTSMEDRGNKNKVMLNYNIIDCKPYKYFF